MFNDLKQNALSSKTSVWYVVGIFIDHCPGFNFDACHVFWELFRILSYFQENTKIDPMSYSIHIPSTHQTPKMVSRHRLFSSTAPFYTPSTKNGVKTFIFIILLLWT